MADGGTSSGSMTFLAFILGGLVLAAVVGGFLIFGGWHFGGQSAPASHVNLTIKAPAAPKT